MDPTGEEPVKWEKRPTKKENLASWRKRKANEKAQKAASRKKRRLRRLKRKELSDSGAVPLNHDVDNRAAAHLKSIAAES